MHGQASRHTFSTCDVHVNGYHRFLSDPTWQTAACRVRVGLSLHHQLCLETIFHTSFASLSPVMVTVLAALVTGHWSLVLLKILSSREKADVEPEA